MEMKLKDLVRGALFYLPKDYANHGDDSAHVRVRGEYDRSTKKYYTERPYRDAIGNGRYMKPDTIVICEENKTTIFAKYI